MTNPKPHKKGFHVHEHPKVKKGFKVHAKVHVKKGFHVHKKHKVVTVKKQETAKTIVGLGRKADAPTKKVTKMKKGKYSKGPTPWEEVQNPFIGGAP